MFKNSFYIALYYYIHERQSTKKCIHDAVDDLDTACLKDLTLF